MSVKKYYVTIDDLGNIRWYKDAKCKVLHRENGPAVEYADGSKLWLQDGKYHRTNGPAIEWASGAKSWYQNDTLHRTDGPAVVYSDGREEWYINDRQLTEAKFLAATQPVVEMTVAEVEKLLGKRVKIVK